MRIKHFSGYGCVNAKKISSTTFTDLLEGDKKLLVVEVKGCHERGLEIQDWNTYEVYRWLVKRFDKSVTSDQQVDSFSVNTDYEPNPHPTHYLDRTLQVCTYKIIISPEK